jgi:hypothetical protein
VASENCVPAATGLRYRGALESATGFQAAKT